MTFPATLPIPAEVLEIATTLENAGYETWCVGGALRDALLGDPHADYDLATSATPPQVQRLFRRTAAVGLKHGTVGVIDRNRVMHEVTSFRRDVATDGRHAEVEYGVSLEDDLARRDFTINAMAYHPLRHEWRDPFRGTGDLAARVIRAVGDPAQRFIEDYLRILRAVRFAARLGFAIEPATWDAALAASEGLRRLSAERVREEWYKGVRGARDLREFLRLWSEVGAARIWTPELAPATGGAGPSGRPRDPVVLTVLVTTDPVALLRRLRASNAEVDRAVAMVAGPPEPASHDEVAVRRWLSRVGPAADDLLELWTLRHAGVPEWAGAVQEIRRRGDPLTRGDLAVSGTDLLALGATGPRVGQVLQALLDRVLEDPSLNARDRLLGLARERL